MQKPKLSGAQRRKLAKAKAAEQLAKGVLVPLPRELSTLNTVRDYRREINSVYRDYHHERITRDSATSRVFILNTGAALAKAEMELEELAKLREQVERIQSGGPPGLEYANASDYRSADLLPSQTEIGNPLKLEDTI